MRRFFKTYVDGMIIDMLKDGWICVDLALDVPGWVGGRPGA